MEQVRRSWWMFGILYGLSGGCGLVYEVVWSRWLSLLLGNTTWGHSLVIGTFMAGLGAGYYVGGRLANGLHRPLRAYGAVEIAIGIWGAISPWLVSNGGRWYAGGWIDGAGPSTALMLAVCAASLFIPTFLMGLTFPIAMKALGKKGQVNRVDVSLLYGLNSAGAALGAILAGFVCMEMLGLTVTCGVTAALNFLIGGIAWFLPSIARETEHSQEPDEDGTSGTPRPFAAMILGFVAMGVQAIWIRLFAVILGSSVYSLSTVLAVFIVGIATGSLLLSRKGLMRKAHLGLACLFLGSALLVSGWVVDHLPLWFGSLRLWCGDLGLPFAVYAVLRFVGVALILLPMTALFGAALPLAVGNRSENPEKAVRVFWVNTIGAVLGAGLTLPFVVPSLGLEGTYRIFILLIVLLGTWETRHLWQRGGENRSIALAILLLAGAAGSMTFDPYLLSAGAFRAKVLPESTEVYREKLMRSELVFYEDGKDASVAVLEKGANRVMKVNGKPDASTRGDMFTQVFSGHLPLLLHPAPSEVLVVGLGSGVTAHAASQYSSQIDVVELSGAVIRGAALFKGVNHGVLDRPGINMFETDARGYLRGQVGTYDVIISEPSNPWMAGNAGLFSVEFFEGVRKALKPGGLLAQWFHTYEMDSETLGLVFQSLAKVFPHVTVWEMFPNDLLMVASSEPLEPQWGKMERLVNNPRVLDSLKEGGLRSLPAILSRQAVTTEGFRQYFDGGGPVNTDDLPLLEYAAPRSLYRKGKAQTLSHMSQRINLPGKGGLLLDRFIQEHRKLETVEWEELFVLHTVYPGAKKTYRDVLLDPLLVRSDARFLKDVLFTFIREGDLLGKEALLGRLIELAPDEPFVMHVVAAALVEARRKGIELDWEGESALSLLQRCVAVGDEPRGRCQSDLKQVEGASL